MIWLFLVPFSFFEVVPSGTTQGYFHRVLPQVLEIIFEVQRKMSNEKIIRREINFLTYKTRFFPFFFSLWTLLTFKPHNFLISYSFETI
jgi:hypothetical protein